MDNKKDNLEYTLKYWMIVVLFIFYSFNLVLGIVVMSYFLIKYDFVSNLMGNTILVSFACCLATCSIQYIKCLYKACIQERVCIDVGCSNFSTKSLGNFIYFLLRPVFACVFILIAVFALKAGIIVITLSETTIVNERFFYICVIMASCIGFSVGKVLDGFETFAQKGIDKYLTGK